ncbi:MAG: hypothetical protein ACD_78C00417G0006 [uncultured bacterium (gcode 4)]|uniref:Transglutaminase-like domain-containing protein n=1 Tax=uncultured bacterium (gcode 4) TaxID=1234023 RepID=K1YAG9_9BACT|nr:MAG: hypothetical protein ACD_78C00417G0006 [uncultured bacterium (gcode 4)]
MPLDLLSKTQVPDALPRDMQAVVDGLKKSKNQEECLKKTYDILNTKYRGYRVKTYTRLFELFITDIIKLWSRNGFLHCTNINYVMRILLLKSGRFQESDIRLKWTLIWYVSPHQYLQVRVNGKWIDVDIWAHAYGIQFGDHAHGFH